MRIGVDYYHEHWDRTLWEPDADLMQQTGVEAELIRKNCPDTEITTNVWFCKNMPNYYDEFKALDFISYDNYPTTRLPDNVEITTRTSDDNTARFIFNNTNKEQHFSIGGEDISLAPFEMKTDIRKSK